MLKFAGPTGCWECLLLFYLLPPLPTETFSFPWASCSNPLQMSVPKSTAILTLGWHGSWSGGGVETQPVPVLYPAELSTEDTLELLSQERGSWVGSRFPASEEEGGQEPSLKRYGGGGRPDCA